MVVDVAVEHADDERRRRAAGLLELVAVDRVGVGLGDDADAGPAGVAEHGDLGPFAAQRQAQQAVGARRPRGIAGVVAELADLGRRLVHDRQRRPAKRAAPALEQRVARSARRARRRRPGRRRRGRGPTRRRARRPSPGRAPPCGRSPTAPAGSTGSRRARRRRRRGRRGRRRPGTVRRRSRRMRPQRRRAARSSAALARSSVVGVERLGGDASAASTSAAYASSWSSRAVIAGDELVMVGQGEHAGQAAQGLVDAARPRPRRRRSHRRAASAASSPPSSSSAVGDRAGRRTADDADDAAHGRSGYRWVRRRHRQLGARRGSRRGAGVSALDGRPAMRSAPTASACASVGASTITRTSGSVPLGRTSTRPWPPSSASTRGDLGGDALGGVGHRRLDRHVDEDLRQAGHRRRGEVGQRPSRPRGRRRASDEPGQQAVARRRQVAEDDVTALLAAERVARRRRAPPARSGRRRPSRRR